MSLRTLLATCAVLISIAPINITPAIAQERPPATPLIAHNPYFSIWSTTDQLTDSTTTPLDRPPPAPRRPHPHRQPPLPLHGPRPRRSPRHAADRHVRHPHPHAVSVHSKRRRSHLTFLTPSLPNDLDLLCRPVTYLTWTAKSTDNAPHQVSILLDVDPIIAVNDRSEPVTTARHQTASLECPLRRLPRPAHPQPQRRRPPHRLGLLPPRRPAR